jgi:hypothetical protein
MGPFRGLQFKPRKQEDVVAELQALTAKVDAIAAELQRARRD